MERDAKYAAVGLFGLIAVACALAFIWWYTGSSDKRQYDPYEIYFFGSVSGLEQGSPVRYLGVDVGRVTQLSVDSRYPGRVKVVAEIDSTAPISGATRAQLGLLGLTGLLFIDLLQDPAAKADQPLAQGDEHLVIRSMKGDIQVFLENLPNIVSRAAGVMERLEAMLADENLASISTTLENIRLASQNAPKLTQNAAELAVELRAAAQEATMLASRLRNVVDATQPELTATMVSAREASQRLSAVAGKLDSIVTDNEAGLRQFSGPGLQELQQLLIDAREASAEVRDLARGLREQPSSLIRETRETGVEIDP